MTDKSIRLGIVGVGKIVRDQHLPALAASPDFKLIASASRNATIDGVQNFRTLEEMLSVVPDLDAIALCMPPAVRFEAACTAIAAGKHVVLEKPPGITVREIETLKKLAEDNGVTLFASWHSRYAPAVEPARQFLRTTTVRAATFIWKEDARKWHPGQTWLWEAGGYGAFDNFINCLSIITHILPPLFVTSAVLDFPENKDAPATGLILFKGQGGLTARAEIDTLQPAPENWDIHLDTDAGQVDVLNGGATLVIDGRTVSNEPEREYPELYRLFADLVRTGRSDVDIAPLQHVADAFMLAKRRTIAPYYE